MQRSLAHMAIHVVGRVPESDEGRRLPPDLIPGQFQNQDMHRGPDMALVQSAHKYRCWATLTTHNNTHPALLLVFFDGPDASDEGASCKGFVASHPYQASWRWGSDVGLGGRGS